jgi:hypothetical protein
MKKKPRSEYRQYLPLVLIVLSVPLMLYLLYIVWPALLGTKGYLNYEGMPADIVVAGCMAVFYLLLVIRFRRGFYLLPWLLLLGYFNIILVFVLAYTLATFVPIFIANGFTFFIYILCMSLLKVLILYVELWPFVILKPDFRRLLIRRYMLAYTISLYISIGLSFYIRAPYLFIPYIISLLILVYGAVDGIADVRSLSDVLLPDESNPWVDEDE